jgi:hypothetical protein
VAYLAAAKVAVLLDEFSVLEILRGLALSWLAAVMKWASPA